jgi:deazaflavin-dependent oxidoreductase (nitroreductase family)
MRMGNIFATTLLHAGVRMGNMALLTVRGRKSGLPRTTPVSLGEQDGRRWLIAAFGEVNWARNLRAAGEATLTQGRHSEAISVVELPQRRERPSSSRALPGLQPLSGSTSMRPRHLRLRILCVRHHAIPCFWCSLSRKCGRRPGLITVRRSGNRAGRSNDCSSDYWFGRSALRAISPTQNCICWRLDEYLFLQCP